VIGELTKYKSPYSEKVAIVENKMFCSDSSSDNKTDICVAAF
jgi:hypothetical protein